MIVLHHDNRVLQEKSVASGGARGGTSGAASSSSSVQAAVPAARPPMVFVGRVPEAVLKNLPETLKNGGLRAFYGNRKEDVYNVFFYALIEYMDEHYPGSAEPTETEMLAVAYDVNRTQSMLKTMTCCSCSKEITIEPSKRNCGKLSVMVPAFPVNEVSTQIVIDSTYAQRHNAMFTFSREDKGKSHRFGRAAKQILKHIITNHPGASVNVSARKKN